MALFGLGQQHLDQLLSSTDRQVWGSVVERVGGSMFKQL